MGELSAAACWRVARAHAQLSLRPLPPSTAQLKMVQLATIVERHDAVVFCGQPASRIGLNVRAG
jgi:hypothetical protein